MKKKTKIIAAVGAVAVIGASSIFASMAYLHDSDDVTNTFTIGDVGITLDEADVDEYGDAVAGADRVQENEYKLIPGHEYTKDPTVHFEAGSEESYLFVDVTNEIAPIESEDEDYVSIADQIVDNGWTKLDGSETVYYQKVAANETSDAIDYVVFSDFKINKDVEKAGLSGYEGKSIEINAYAIQADGFDTAADAWDALNDY